MLSKELIQQNIPELEDEQVISKIVELGNNTFTIENQNEVDKVIKKLRGQVDEVLQKHGFPKGGDKTTDHLDNVLITLKESQMTDDFKTKYKSLEEQNRELSEQIKQSNPDWSKKEKDLQDKIQLLQKANEEQKQNYDNSLVQHKQDLLKIHLLSSIPKVKEDISEKTKELHTNYALDNLLKLADFDEKGNVIFRDTEGKILYNSENKNNPFTAAEMWSKDDYFKDIIHIDSSKNGLNLKDGVKLNNNTVVTISGAKTQLEADDIINKMLLSKGITNQSENYIQEFDKIRKENNISKLPMR